MAPQASITWTCPLCSAVVEIKYKCKDGPVVPCPLHQIDGHKIGEKSRLEIRTNHGAALEVLDAAIADESRDDESAWEALRALGKLRVSIND